MADGDTRWQDHGESGCLATAEEAALCVARSPEGRVAAKRVASAPPPRMSDEEGQGKHPSMPSRAVLKEEGTVPPMPLGAFVKEEEIPRQAPSSNIKEEVVVKREHGARVDRRRGSGRTIIVLYKKGCHFSGGSGHRPAHLSSAIWPLALQYFRHSH